MNKAAKANISDVWPTILGTPVNTFRSFATYRKITVEHPKTSEVNNKFLKKILGCLESPLEKIRESFQNVFFFFNSFVPRAKRGNNLPGHAQALKLEVDRGRFKRMFFLERGHTNTVCYQSTSAQATQINDHVPLYPTWVAPPH